MKKKEIGLRIKKLRTQAKLTQQAVADYLGIDQTTLSKIESGERVIDTVDLDAILTLFLCSRDAFEKGCIENNPVQFAFRAEGITRDDLRAISDVNRIMLNSIEMEEILEKSL